MVSSLLQRPCQSNGQTQGQAQKKNEGFIVSHLWPKWSLRQQMTSRMTRETENGGSRQLPGLDFHAILNLNLPRVYTQIPHPAPTVLSFCTSADRCCRFSVSESVCLPSSIPSALTSIKARLSRLQTVIVHGQESRRAIDNMSKLNRSRLNTSVCTRWSGTS